MSEGVYGDHLDFRLYALIDGDVVGIADSYGYGENHFLTICVSPENRGKGLGERLVRAALEIEDLFYVVAEENTPSLKLALKIFKSVENTGFVKRFTNADGIPCAKFKLDPRAAVELA